MGWVARAIGAEENYSGGTIRPAEHFFGNLAIFLGTSSLNAIWKGSTAFVRASWEWEGFGLIYTPYTKISFNERNYVSLGAKPPFQIEISINADVRDYTYSIWEEKLIYKTNSFTVNVSKEILLLPQNTKRDSVLVINQGGNSANLSFNNGIAYLIEIEPGYSASFEPGTLDGIWGKSSGTTNLKVIEVTKE